MKQNYKKWAKILFRELNTYLEENRKIDDSHDIGHITRTWKIAEKIGRRKHADMEILTPMTILHDLGDAHRDKKKHGRQSAARAYKILKKIRYPKGKLRQIMEGIEIHDLNDVDHALKETKILYDADKIDSFGAIGITRWLDTDLALGFSLKECAEHSLRAMKKRYNKLYNKEAKELCRKDYLFAKRYFEKLKKEIEGAEK
jgi:uncharacterized protein